MKKVLALLTAAGASWLALTACGSLSPQPAPPVNITNVMPGGDSGLTTLLVFLLIFTLPASVLLGVLYKQEQHKRRSVEDATVMVLSGRPLSSSATVILSQIYPQLLMRSELARPDESRS